MLRKSIELRGENEFKLGAPMKSCFATSREIYGNNDVEFKKKTPKKQVRKTEHDSEFRPSCCKKFDIFSYPDYQPGGQRPEKKKGKKGNETERAENFKPVKNPNFYKPSPSVTTLRTNLMRSIR